MDDEGYAFLDARWVQRRRGGGSGSLGWEGHRRQRRAAASFSTEVAIFWEFYHVAYYFWSIIFLGDEHLSSLAPCTCIHPVTVPWPRQRSKVSGRQRMAPQSVMRPLRACTPVPRHARPPVHADHQKTLSGTTLWTQSASPPSRSAPACLCLDTPCLTMHLVVCRRLHRGCGHRHRLYQPCNGGFLYQWHAVHRCHVSPCDAMPCHGSRASYGTRCRIM